MRATSRRRVARARGTRYAGDPGAPLPERPADRNAGRDGYAECELCGKWVRPRFDGTVRRHVDHVGLPCVTPWADDERIIAAQSRNLGACAACGQWVPLIGEGKHARMDGRARHECVTAGRVTAYQWRAVM